MSVEVHLTRDVDLSWSSYDGGWRLLDYRHGWVSDETWPSDHAARDAFEHAEVHWVLG